MIRRFAAAALALLLAACAHGGGPTPQPPPPLGPVTIADPASFLAPPGRHDGDPAPTRRFDWGAYQAADAFALADGSLASTWSYAPFGPFVQANGDGGEVYVIDGPTVRIVATQDGGKPYLQGFYGAACGGSGWVIFRSDAPTGQWNSLTAWLDDLPLPSNCSAATPAFTRYRYEQLAIPFLIAGARIDITLPAIISEHFNNASVEKATALERSIYAQGYGRLIWEAWTTGAPAGSDLDARCPPTAYSVPPAPGWSLSDCRVSTNIVAGSPPPFGWPPAGLTWP